VDIIQQIIDFVLSLLGQGKPAAKPALAGAAARSPGATKARPTAKPARASAASSVQGLEELEGAEHVKVAAGNVELARDGAALIRDEDDGTLLWIDQVDKSMPRAKYRDVWGPLRGPDDESLADFLMHELAFTMEMQADAHAAERKLQGFGYADAGEFYRVRATIIKHFATPTGPSLDDSVLDSQRVMSASMKSHQRLHQANRAAATAANPELLAPIEGVTLEKYAQLAAKAAAGLSKSEFAALLAGEGLDLPAYERVTAGWTRRMQEDTSYSLVAMYGQAFQASGTGQFGAAAKAHAATGYDGSAAGGEAPMPFERVCEIQGACSAWAKTGQDVNANLAKVFGLNAAGFAAAHSWWLSQITADLSRFGEYNARIEAAEAKYSAGMPADPDADVQF
jgi:hypothetical protein